MSNKEENLDLSKVTVSKLLNDQSIPDSTDPKPEEPVEEQVEETVEATDESGNVQETPVEGEAQEETQSEESVEEPVTDATEEPVAENSESEEDSEPTIIQSLKDRLGYEIDGEFGEDYDGIIGLTKAAATKMAEEQFESVFSAFPDIQEYLNYRISGGDPEKYFKVAAKEIDFNTLKVDEKDVGMQKKIVETFLGHQGYTPEEIADTVQDYEDAKLLYKNASRAVQKLAVTQEQNKKQLLEQQQKDAQQAAQQTQQTWSEISGIINKGKLRDFTIPESDKKKFYNWMATPVDAQGRSQRLLDREKMDQESILAMEFLIYKGLDISKLVNTKATTRQAVNLKAKLKSNTQTATRRMKGNKGGYNKSQKRTSVPSLDKLFS